MDYWHPLAGQFVPTYWEMPLLLESLGILARISEQRAIHVYRFEGRRMVHFLDVLPSAPAA